MSLSDKSSADSNFVCDCSDSGAQYYDGTCYTARTLHFGKPTDEICEAYTRVLQGHVRFFHSYSEYTYLIFFTKQIAIDSAVFREGTSIRHLDVLARKTLWKDEPNYRVSYLWRCTPNDSTVQY